MSDSWNNTLAFDCPHCGQENHAQPDPVDGFSTFVQDCAVCCRPILIETEIRRGRIIQTRVERENG